MKTKMSENEVNRVPVDALALALMKLPYNGQDDNDKRLAEHFLFKHVGTKLNSRLNKLNDGVKALFPDDQEMFVIMSENYRLEAKKGEARENFDPDRFIEMVCAKYPAVSKPELVAMKAKAKKATARPVTIDIEYIGDVVKAKKPATQDL